MSYQRVLLHLVLIAGWTWAVSRAGASRPEPGEVARQLDELLARELFSDEVELAPRTADATFLRRVWLDLLGDIPAPEDLTAFVLDPDPAKRQRLVDRLLARPEFGRNWARYWRDVILARRLEERSLLVGKPLVADLTDWINENHRWDEISRRFIVALGDVQADGATAIVAAQDGRTEETTAEIARIFLGIQIQCAQCHDHPYDRWKREEFHELAAYFPRVALRPVRTPVRRSFEVVADDRPRRRAGANNMGRRGNPEHTMPDLDDPSAPGTEMTPRFFLTGEEVPRGTPDARRREQAAQAIVTSPWFAMALVNRIWAELVGEGFYEPIDDLGPDRTPSAPEAARLLADAFAASGHDLKWLFRTVCRTEAYQRASRPRRLPDGVPFTANAAQRLRGDQLFDAILTALSVDEPEISAASLSGRGGYGRRPSPRALFTNFFGYDPSDPRDTIGGSIPQTLAMMNTPQINRLLRGGAPRTMLGQVLNDNPDDDPVILELYLRLLTREPTDAEFEHARQYLASCDNRTEAFEDLLWALLNSAEFVHRR